MDSNQVVYKLNKFNPENHKKLLEEKDLKILKENRTILLQFTLFNPNDFRPWFQLTLIDAESNPQASLLHLEQALELGFNDWNLLEKNEIIQSNLSKFPKFQLLKDIYNKKLCGYLEKRLDNGPLRRWRKRYVEQRGPRLYWFAEKDDDVPLNFLDLTNVSMLSRSNRDACRFDVTLRGETKPHRFRANDSENVNNWCRQLSSTLSALSKRNDALLSNDDVIKPSVVKENVEQALAVVKQTLQGNDEGLRALAAIDESIRAQQQQFETFSPCYAALKQQSIVRKKRLDQALKLNEELFELKTTLGELRAASFSYTDDDKDDIKPSERLTLHAMRVLSELTDINDNDSVKNDDNNNDKPSESSSRVETVYGRPMTIYGRLSMDRKTIIEHHQAPATQLFDATIVDAELLDENDIEDDDNNNDDNKNNDEEVEQDDNFFAPLPAPPIDESKIGGDFCHMCNAAEAESIVTTDDQASQRLCGNCTAAIQVPLPSIEEQKNESNETSPGSKSPPPKPSRQATVASKGNEKRRTVIAIQQIMKLQQEHANTIKQRAQSPTAPPVKSKPPAPPAPRSSKPLNQLCTACNKRPANAKVTVRGSLSTNAPESEHITIKRFMCRVCLNEERRAMLKAQKAKRKPQPPPKSIEQQSWSSATTRGSTKNPNSPRLANTRDQSSSTIR